MINSRDSYSDFNPNKKEFIEVPYAIGTVVELNENPNVLAKICQYRIIVKDYRKVINVGLSSNIHSENEAVEYEIPSEELERKWKKSDKLIIEKLEPENFVRVELPNEEPLFEVLKEKTTGPVKTLKKNNTK